MGSIFIYVFRIFIKLSSFFMGVWILDFFFSPHIDEVVVLLRFLFNYFIGSILSYESTVLVRDFILLIFSYYFFSYVFLGANISSSSFGSSSELVSDSSSADSPAEIPHKGYSFLYTPKGLKVPRQGKKGRNRPLSSGRDFFPVGWGWNNRKNKRRK